MVVNLEDTAKGLCKIFNTESRVAEVLEEEDRVAKAGTIIQTEAQALRGRLQFAQAQPYGRTGKRCIEALKDSTCRKGTKLVEHQILSLRLFVQLMQPGKPRTVDWDARKPVVMFTDACYERDAKDLVCGLGGTFIDQHSGCKLFFSCALNGEQ